jgi:hypothetical protein
MFSRSQLCIFREVFFGFYGEVLAGTCGDDVEIAANEREVLLFESRSI